MEGWGWETGGKHGKAEGKHGVTEGKTEEEFHKNVGLAKGEAGKMETRNGLEGH